MYESKGILQTPAELIADHAGLASKTIQSVTDNVVNKLKLMNVTKHGKFKIYFLR